MNHTPNTLSRCEDLGVCVMDPNCQRRLECASEVATLPRDLPCPTGALDDEPLLTIENVEGLFVAVVAICASVLVGAATLWLLWRFGAPLRAAASSAWHALQAMGQAAMTLNY